MRIERDSLGEVEVPEGALWGAQTARAVANFPLSGQPVGGFPVFVGALAQVKRAAARVNARLGALDPALGAGIEAACVKIIAGRHAEAFPVDVFQGGAGASTNMNMNEVVANRALQIMGHAVGRHDILHPNDHVNLAQSTNDAYPTALRVALPLHVERLRAGLAALADAFAERGAAFAGVVKLRRTQLQDAVPMTLGREFLAFAATLGEDHDRLAEVAALFHEG